jgi:hypothetical protein
MRPRSEGRNLMRHLSGYRLTPLKILTAKVFSKVAVTTEIAIFCCGRFL